MTSRDSASSEITPEVLLRAYACGIFPMAESADDPTLFWVEPEMRGVIPLDGFRISSRLARTVRSDTFTVTVDKAFKAVMAGCAAPAAGREDTWINKRIRDLYDGLHALGHCHSIEVWQDGDAVAMAERMEPVIEVADALVDPGVLAAGRRRGAARHHGLEGLVDGDGEGIRAHGAREARGDAKAVERDHAAHFRLDPEQGRIVGALGHREDAAGI